MKSTRQSLRGGRIAGLLTAIALLVFLASCSIPVTPATVYSDHVFRIIATSAYSGELVTDTSTTAISGSANQNLTVTASNGQQYTLTVGKMANDGTSLTVELVSQVTIDGTATSNIVETATTTDPTVPARVVLIN